jgi:hypothetical protein
MPVSSVPHLLPLARTASVPWWRKLAHKGRARLVTSNVEAVNDPEAGYSRNQVKEKLKSGSWHCA